MFTSERVRELQEKLQNYTPEALVEDCPEAIGRLFQGGHCAFGELSEDKQQLLRSQKDAWYCGPVVSKRRNLIIWCLLIIVAELFLFRFMGCAGIIATGFIAIVALSYFYLLFGKYKDKQAKANGLPAGVYVNDCYMLDVDNKNICYWELGRIRQCNVLKQEYVERMKGDKQVGSYYAIVVKLVDENDISFMMSSDERFINDTMAKIQARRLAFFTGIQQGALPGKNTCIFTST